MFSLRSFWRRHKKKIFVTFGILGSGYFLYKLYDAQKCRLLELDRELARERQNDERIKAQMQEHFETIQRIADTATLPHAMNVLSSRIDEELNLSVLTERLKQGKDTLTLPEKLELWDRLKVLSFTKMVLSLWSVTMLNLFVRVQVNILGRHLYIDIARGLESSPLLEECTLIDHDDEQKFLSSADFLATHGLPALINTMQAAAVEILKSKQLKDIFNSSILHDTIMQILDTFMSMGKPHHWMGYLMPEDVKVPSLTPSSSSNNLVLCDASKFEQLVSEAQTVLTRSKFVYIGLPLSYWRESPHQRHWGQDVKLMLTLMYITDTISCFTPNEFLHDKQFSDEFTNVVEVSLKSAANALVKDVTDQFGVGTAPSGIPLVKLVPRVAQMSQLLLDELSRNQFIQMIGNIQEVELFFTILYANTSTV